MARILIVEDDALIAADIQETLEDLGYEVAALVQTAADAVRAVEEHAPDLVLMDIHLRGSDDGVHAATRIRERSDVPIVYLTSDSDDATLARAKETAPHGYLLKPLSAPDLRTCVEVAIRKRELERNLAERERWFSTTLQSLGDAVIATDTAERVTFMNGAAETLTGYAADEARGRPLRDVFRVVDPSGEPLVNPIGRSLRSPAGGLLVEARMVDRSGVERLVQDAASTIVDDRGALLGGVVVFRDVTEQRRLEQRLTTSERMAALGTMAAGIAHEVNNPLAAVVANVSFACEELDALRPALDEETRRSIDGVLAALADAGSGADRVGKVVSAMRRFARPQKAHLEVSDLQDLVETALRLTENAIRNKARLMRAYLPAPRVEVNADQTVQVLTNLLLNACDAIDEGHVEDNEIHVCTSTDDTGRAMVEVRDTGAGIAPEDLGRIFDPFYSTKGVGAGMGLGLAICHAFATSAGGELTARSAPGVGSVFRLALPPAPRVARRATVSGIAPIERAARASLPADGRARVLVIDDEPAVVRTIQRVLRDHDVSVETDGRRALARIAGGARFDVVFCDVMMPGFGGAEFHEALAASHPAQAKRVVFLTGGAFSPAASRFLEGVADRTLAKPFAPDALRCIVEAYRDAARDDGA